jgi:hypothetical protein
MSALTVLSTLYTRLYDRNRVPFVHSICNYRVLDGLSTINNKRDKDVEKYSDMYE